MFERSGVAHLCAGYVCPEEWGGVGSEGCGRRTLSVCESAGGGGESVGRIGRVVSGMRAKVSYALVTEERH